jgi:hypothetical protein
MHGSSEGEFLCGDCIGERKEQVEAKRRDQFEAEIAVVRTCVPVAESLPADSAGPRPDPPLGRPLKPGEGLGEHHLPQVLWADGERKGFANLVGLMWTQRYGGEGTGERWQIVHHHRNVRRGQVLVRRGLLRTEHYEEGVVDEQDSWTAYAYWPDAGRLCDIQQFKGSELSDHWTRLRNRAGGSILHDLSWGPLLDLPGTPLDATPVAVPLNDKEALFSQLAAHGKTLGLETWIGLTWTDYQGRLCRVVDDAMVQANRSGLPTAYRAIVIDKSEDGTTVDREVIRADGIDGRFNEIGRELGNSFQNGEFTWFAT